MPSDTSPSPEKHFRILLVEDDEPTRQFMSVMLKAQRYEVIEARDGNDGWARVQESPVDLVVSDIMMPHCDGFELTRRIKTSPGHELLPVILCTAMNGDDDRLRGLEAGADDFLTKPINEAELRIRIRNFCRVVTLQHQVEHARDEAEKLVEIRTKELRESFRDLEIAHAETAIAQLDVIHRLAAATEYKDADTGAHIQRIAETTHMLSQCLGWFEDEQAAITGHASMMHDLGKIGIPDYILMKPGLLSNEEFDLMKQHTIIGWKLLSGSRTPLLQCAARIARSHHEKWDGSGYPDGLAGEDIPAEARIVAVADVFDALRAQRCYKPEYPLDHCFEMLAAQKGKHFDPEVVEAFMLIRDDIGRIAGGVSTSDADAA